MTARGMTQEKLANELDRGQSWVNHKLSGRRKTNVEDIVLIAQALDISPAELLENLSNPNQLRKNLLVSGSAEPKAKYSVHSLPNIARKLEKLEPDAREHFLQQVELMLDDLVSSKASRD